ncbi:MAG: FecR domain-containing protein [Planctomycetota bacterium]
MRQQKNGSEPMSGINDPASSAERDEALTRLAVAACDDSLDRRQTEELEQLLSADILNVQQYLSFTYMHCSLLRLDRTVSADVIWERVERGLDAEQAAARPAAYFVQAAGAVLAACVFLAVVAWSFIPREMPVTARVVAVSDSSALGAPSIALGQIIRLGDSLNIDDGFITIETTHGVSVDLAGPVKANFTGEDVLNLASGLVSAHVGTTGHGFTVRTEDADVIDRGTEFIVSKDFSEGTQVHVMDGHVDAILKDRDGVQKRVVELLAGQSVSYSFDGQAIEGFDFRLTDRFDRYENVRSSRGGILRYGGVAGPLGALPEVLDLRTKGAPTGGRVTIVPERTGFELREAVSVSGRFGNVSLPAGTVVDSYIAHFDVVDGQRIVGGGDGSVTFDGEIVAIISDAESLAATDALFGRPSVVYEDVGHRGLEGESDQLDVNPDRSSVTFDLDAESLRPLDQFRVLVRRAQ